MVLSVLLKIAIAASSLVSVPVTIRGGYETLPIDHGRPVILIASALGVKPAIFRDAFNHVRPARPNETPSDERVHGNKEQLLLRLSPYGITNERLDEVSDYYRYQPGNGELWHHRPARLVALFRNGKFVGIKVKDSGEGYSSLPQLIVPGHPDLKFEVRIAYGQDFDRNGSFAAVSPIN